MKIAIPLFGARISPRFDHSKKFLLVEAENDTIIKRQELLIEGWTSLTVIRRLKELGVDALVCGGIDRFSAWQLNFNGIRIYPWVTGEVEKVLRCFLEGKLEAGTMMGPGGRQCSMWRFIGESVQQMCDQKSPGKEHARGFGHRRRQGRR